MNLSKYALIWILMAAVCSCTTTTAPKEVPEPGQSFALPPGKDGGFADLEATFAEKHGKPRSGFLLLDNNAESLCQRLMLIDEAR